MKKTFPIKGMHCASCVRVIENALSKVEGVTEANVNLANETATVTFNPQKVNDQTLASAVANVGYKAGVEDELKTEDEDKIQKQKELKKLRAKALVSLFLGSLIVWGSFPGLMDTAPLFLRNFFTQMILAIPIQFWAGLQFYKATIPALKHRTANMDTLITIGTAYNLTEEEDGQIVSCRAIGVYAEKFLKQKPIAYFREVRYQPWTLDGNFYSRIREEKIAPKNLIFFEDEDNYDYKGRLIYREKPNFSVTIDSWIQHSSLYGDVTTKVYSSNNGNIIYLFNKDQDNRVWIGSVQNADGKITSMGIYDKWLFGDNLITSVFEYAGYDGGYGDHVNTRGKYVDMFPKYLSKIPIIKEYLRFLKLKKK